MEKPRVQLIGDPCGHHGPYSFYKAFKYLRGGKFTILSLGQFFFLKILNGIPVCIGELQLVWKDKSNSQELASVRLYFRPEDTPDGRQPHHGKDEILALSEKLVLKLDDLVTLIVRGVKWTGGRKGILDTEDGSRTKSEQEKMAEAFTVNTFGFDLKDVDKEREIIGDEPDTSSTEVHILSYAKYCRYRCVLKRLETCTDRLIKHAIVCAIGGFTVKRPDNLVFFCRGFCEYPELDDFELRCDHLAPNLKGRPRKRKGLKRENSEDSESSSESASTPTKPAIKIRFGKRATPLRNGFKLEREKVSKDEQAFLIDLHKFMKSRNTPIGRIPSLGFKQIDLYHFYTMAEKIGGYEQITAKRMWKYLYDQLGGNPGSTSAATCTRRHYEKLLLAYERHMNGEHPKPMIKKKQSVAMAVLKRAKMEKKPLIRPVVEVKREVKVTPEVRVTESEKVNGKLHESVSSLTDSQQKALIIKKEIQKMKLRKNAQRLMEKEKIWDDRRKQKLYEKVRKPSGGQKTVRELLDANGKGEDSVGDMKLDADKLTSEHFDRQQEAYSVLNNRHVVSESKADVKIETSASQPFTVSQSDTQIPVHPGLPTLGIPSPMFFPPGLIPMAGQIQGVGPMSLPVMIPQFRMPFPMQSTAAVSGTSVPSKDAKPLHALNKLVSDKTPEEGQENLDSRYSSIHNSVNRATQRTISQSQETKIPPPPSNHIHTAHQGSALSPDPAPRTIVPAHSNKRSYPSHMELNVSAPNYHIPSVPAQSHTRETTPSGSSVSYSEDSKRQRLCSPSGLGYQSNTSDSVKDDAPVLDLSMKTMRAQEAKHTKDVKSTYNKENKGAPNHEQYALDAPQDLSLKLKPTSPCDLSKKSSSGDGRYKGIPLNVPSHIPHTILPPSVHNPSSRKDNSSSISHTVETIMSDRTSSALKSPPFTASSLPADVSGAFVHPAFRSPFMVPPGMFPTPVQLQQMIQGQVAPGLPVVSPEFIPPSVLFPASAMPTPSAHRGASKR